MEREELERRVFGSHFVLNLLEGVERLGFLFVNVFLINLVGQEHYALFGAESDDLLHVVLRQHLTSRVSRVDHDKCARNSALGLRSLVTALQLLIRQRPSLGLVQVIRQLRASQQGNSRRVERVLRDGNHDSIDR